MLKGNDTLREMKAITALDEDKIYSHKIVMKAFLQGAAYQLIKDWYYSDRAPPRNSFCARDLLGGSNGEWEGTPMDHIYKYYIDEGKTEKEAFDTAAQAAGWLLKEVLAEDTNIKVDNSEVDWYARMYKFLGKKNT